MARVNKQYREDAKERIIGAAIEVALVKGWDAVTLDAIAQNVGVTIPALYSYFRNIDALRDEVVIRVIQNSMVELEATLAGGEDIHRILRDYADLLFAQQKRFATIFTSIPFRILRDSQQREEIARAYTTGLIIFRDCLARAQARGEIPRQVDPVDAARLVSAVGMGLNLSSMFIEKTDNEKEKMLCIEAMERILLIGKDAGKTR